MNQCEEILTQIKKAFVGKKDVARKILMTMLAEGTCFWRISRALAKQRLP